MKILVKDLVKSYNQIRLFHLSQLELNSGDIYCLMGASGSGKTTFMRILLGLDTADSGTVTITGGNRFTAVFQENRLCESFSPLENIMMVMKRSVRKDDLLKELSRILPDECLERPVSTLSGGMKRRVAVCRAMAADSDGIIMDEPFTGLDPETRQTVINYIKERLNGRMLLISTHQSEDISLLKGKVIYLTGGNAND